MIIPTNDFGGDDASRLGYGDVAHVYRSAGWQGVLPLPAGKKWAPPVGFTGHEGGWPTDEQIDKWVAEFPAGNTCVRLPRDFLGIDVDNYGDKKGGLTFAEAERRWGKLPPTWTATSREDGVSGIRLFRGVPPDAAMPGGIKFLTDAEPLGGVDIIRPAHRYVVCYPSIHPETGRQYCWKDPSGNWSDTPPKAEELPELPKEWVEGLAGMVGSKREARRVLSGRGAVPMPDLVSRWLTPGEMSDKVKTKFSAGIAACAGQSRHDDVLSITMALIGLGRDGEPGVFEAISQLGEMFVDKVSEDRDGEYVTAQEYLRMIYGAPSKMDEGSRIRNRLVVTPFSRIGPPRRVRYLVSDLVPLGIPTLVVGEENTGKSLFEILLAARITTGEGIPELGLREGQPGDVAMICENDAQSMILPRLMAAGANLERVHRISLNENGTGIPTFPRDMGELLGMHPVPRLTIVDPLTVTLPEGDKHATADMYRILRPWEDYAQSKSGQVTPLLTTHANRTESRYLRNCYGVSAALRQSFAVTIWALKNSEGQLIVGIDKTNVGPLPAACAFAIQTMAVDIEGEKDEIPLLVPIGRTTMTVQQWHEREFDLRRDRGRGQDLTPLEWLKARLEEGPEWLTKLVTDAAEHQGQFSENQLRTAKKKLPGCTTHQSRGSKRSHHYWTTDSDKRREPDHPHPEETDDDA